MHTLNSIKTDLAEAQRTSNSDPERFFKTGPGSYAEHDQFLGIPVPTLRVIAKKHRATPLADIKKLLRSKMNEERLLALYLLIHHYQTGDEPTREAIYQFYLDHLAFVNNWNLVDASAHLIMGTHLIDSNKSILWELAQSNDLWERRVAIVATWYFIRHDDFKPTLKIAKQLLKDQHDLIHKAVGWMLREVGKRDESVLLAFLDTHSTKMPRTMLRYAIERLDKDLRLEYLSSSKR